MDEIKKGIEPTKEDNTQTQLHNSKLRNICLVIFAAALGAMFAGKMTNNPEVVAIGMGAAGTIAVIEVFRNTKED